jgi:ribonuclease P protein component
MHVAPRVASAWPPDQAKLLPTAGVSGAPSQAERSGAYARIKRIVKTDEFSSVFRLRPVQRTAHFVLYARSNGLTHARLGVVVAKRLAPRAVTRNTVKRMTREFFRLAELPEMDFVVRLSVAVNSRTGAATNTALRKGLRQELSILFHSQSTANTAS